MLQSKEMTDLERALADIAEVRERLGHVQRFKGYSGLAAAISGVFALAAGVVQWLLVPSIRTSHDGHLYFAIWFACCAASMVVNYGAIASESCLDSLRIRCLLSEMVKRLRQYSQAISRSVRSSSL